MVAVQRGKLLGVQSTSIAGRKPHLDKMRIENQDATRDWLEAGGLLYLICWRKRKVKRGGTAFRYEPVLDEITLAQLSAGADSAPPDELPHSDQRS